MEGRILLDKIAVNKISDVNFISGAMHNTQLLKIEPPSFYTLSDLSVLPIISDTIRPLVEDYADKTIIEKADLKNA